MKLIIEYLRILLKYEFIQEVQHVRLLLVGMNYRTFDLNMEEPKEFMMSIDSNAFCNKTSRRK